MLRPRNHYLPIFPSHEKLQVMICFIVYVGLELISQLVVAVVVVMLLLLLLSLLFNTQFWVHFVISLLLFVYPVHIQCIKYYRQKKTKKQKKKNSTAVSRNSSLILYSSTTPICSNISANGDSIINGSKIRA